MWGCIKFVLAFIVAFAGMVSVTLIGVLILSQVIGD
jgi:hypothetical protein